MAPAPTYLDHAATTPLRAEARRAMAPFVDIDGDGSFANPSGGHALARAARRAVDDAREAVATVLGCAPGEIVFTSGGTEADNHAVLGTVRRHGGRALATTVEHHAVLHPVEHTGGTLVDVDRSGVVDLDALERALTTDSLTTDSPANAAPANAAPANASPVRIVSVMAANNEVGTIQPLLRVTRLVSKRAPAAYVHTDAVQGAAWLDLAVMAKHCHLISLSAHKLGGPKGVGVLVVRNGVSLEPLLFGGGQERDRRSGTHNVAGIVGLAAALQATAEQRVDTEQRVRALRDRLLDGLLARVPGLHETVPRDAKVAGAAHVCVEGVESEALLYLLEREGVYASAASSCASGAMEPSHVLLAMGVPKELWSGALRLTLGFASTDADVERALDVVPAAVAHLRRER
jgi:cysteine desulfurase